MRDFIKRYHVLAITALTINIIACGLAFYLFPKQYRTVMEQGEIKVVVDSTLHSKINGVLPPEIILDKDTLRSRKYIDGEEQIVLSTYVDKNDPQYASYTRAVEKLAYASNNNTADAWKNLVWLTLCFVILGCVARTLFDYICVKCYRPDKYSMETWWSWYIFRLVLGAPITAFIVVASRCAMFSTLFTSKDLNTYLVVSFLAGFAMMEFLEMLRGTSKGLFGKYYGSTKEKKED